MGFPCIYYLTFIYLESPFINIGSFTMTQKTEPYLVQKLEEGKSFLATSVDLNIADTNTVEYVVTVPDNAGIRYAPTTVSVNAGGKLRIQFKKDVTIDSAGTTNNIYVANRKVNDTPPNTEVNIEKAGTYSGGTIIADEFVQSTGTGTGNNKIIGGGVTSTPSFSVYPGHNLYVEITNASGQTIDIGLRKIFTELPL